MMPTVEQIKRLNQFLLDTYSMQIPPDVIKFSHRDNKPYIIILLESIHDLKMVRWMTIDWKGNLGEGDEKEIF